MADVNTITITGRLTHNAATKTIGDGKCLLTFGVANNIGFGDYAKTNYYTVNMWGARGLNLLPYLVKGTQVGVSGEESLNIWHGKDGTEHQERVITTNNISLLSSAKQNKPNEVPADESAPEYPEDAVF